MWLFLKSWYGFMTHLDRFGSEKFRKNMLLGKCPKSHDIARDCRGVVSFISYVLFVRVETN